MSPLCPAGTYTKHYFVWPRLYMCATLFHTSWMFTSQNSQSCKTSFDNQEYPIPTQSMREKCISDFLGERTFIGDKITTLAVTIKILHSFTASLKWDKATEHTKQVSESYLSSTIKE